MDPRNTPVSTTNPQALAHYETALKRFQTYFGDPIAAIDAAITEAPDFVVAHLFKSAAFYLATEQRTYATAQAHLEKARDYLHQANDREQHLFQAIELLVNGKWQSAGLAFDRLLQAYPTDVFALQCAHVLDFFRGDALNLRNRPARLLPLWDKDQPGYAYLLGTYAFGLEECNQYAQAETTGLAALEMNPVNPWCIHAVTHVYEMQDRTPEGIVFLEERYIDWAPDNGFAYHNWWHLTLFYLEQNNIDKVLTLVDEKIFADVSDSLVLLDITAMLWRLYLLGIDVEARCQQLAEVWASKQQEAGFYAFNDYHAALSFAATGATDLLADLLSHLQHRLSNPDNKLIPEANRSMTEEIGLPLIQATQHYVNEDYRHACELMLKVRDRAYRFGGSHAQRDIINLTLLSAAAKSGDTKLSRYLLNERQMNKPIATLGQRIVAAAV